MKRFIPPFLLLLLGMELAASAQNHTITGYITDQESGEALIGATVVRRGTGAGVPTNTFGFYSITLPSDTVTLLYSYIGFQPKVHSFLLKSDTVINVEMTSSEVLDEVLIESSRYADPIQETTQMSSIAIPIEQIKSMPALLGEVDVLKVMQLLPGVQSGSEGTSGLYVRGGGPDQNLILLDGVPVYNASHLFGFFSVFNADAINHVNLIKGGFPAQYGGRLSSVIDITMKEGNSKEFRGEGSIGLISSKLTLEGPIIKDRTSFIISGRRTYIDVLSRPIIRAVNNNEGVFGYFFHDLNAKINHKFNDKNRLFVSTYLGKDRAFAREQYGYQDNQIHRSYRDEFGLQWGNITTAIRYTSILGPRLFSNLTLTYSDYNFEIAEDSRELVQIPGSPDETYEYGFSYFSGIEDYGAKWELDYSPSPAHLIRGGASFVNHTFKPGATQYTSNTENDTTFGERNYVANESYLFIQDDFEVTPRLKINAGLHFSTFFVDDVWYKSWQPRFSSRFLINPSLSLKASWVRMTQFIHLLTNSGIGLPTDLWLPSTPQIQPEQSSQAAIGLAQTLKGDFEISLEGYYKTMDNLIEYKDGASFLGIDKSWENKVEVGRGRSYGAELLVQKKKGMLTGWVGYTWSKTERQFDELNFGNWFPYRYDRRHDLSVTAVYQLSEKWALSGAWVYGTGNAISLPEAKYFKPNTNFYQYYGEQVDYYSSRNAYRMRDYHRLDISFSRTKKKKWGEGILTLGVYNAYSRRNPFFIDLAPDENGDLRFVQYSLFPVIPSISYAFKF